jgi:hypothetical protein
MEFPKVLAGEGFWVEHGFTAKWMEKENLQVSSKEKQQGHIRMTSQKYLFFFSFTLFTKITLDPFVLAFPSQKF